MPGDQYPAWLKGVFFNPDTMAYQAVTEGIDLQETDSYMHKLQDHELLEVLRVSVLSCLSFMTRMCQTLTFVGFVCTVMDYHYETPALRNIC
jgi:hypothetical protein